MKIRTLLLALSLFLCLIPILSACSMSRSYDKVQIVDIRMACGVDDKLMPVNVKDAFPEGTAKVFCWFRWRDAKVNTVVTAKWHYVTDDIHILDYNFGIPRKEGSGSVSLAMPADKKLPSGQYMVTLEAENRPLRAIKFKVL